MESLQYGNGNLLLVSRRPAPKHIYFIQGETVAPYVFHAVPMRLMVRKDQVEAVRERLDAFVQSSAYGGLKRVMD